MSSLVILIVIAVAVILALGLAYLPMRLLLTHMANRVSAFIQRQRERRALARGTPDRRRPV
jgi:hypothetical protein